MKEQLMEMIATRHNKSLKVKSKKKKTPFDNISNFNLLCLGRQQMRKKISEHKKGIKSILPIHSVLGNITHAQALHEYIPKGQVTDSSYCQVDGPIAPHIKRKTIKVGSKRASSSHGQATNVISPVGLSERKHTKSVNE